MAGIVAAAEALAATDTERATETVRIAALRDRLVAGLVDGLPDARETVPPAAKVAGSAHVMFDGIESEALLYLLDEAGVCASAASACASGAMDPSHVLAAMGVERSWAAGALRMTLGRTTTDADVDVAIETLTGAVAQLRRRASPVGPDRADLDRGVMVAMSGGVDSSVAAALLARAGHDVVGVTMRLWGGQSDTGCCSVSDVDDARRDSRSSWTSTTSCSTSPRTSMPTSSIPTSAAQPAAPRRIRASSATDAIKFAAVSPSGPRSLGFDAVATGHHARVDPRRCWAGAH